MTPDVPGQKSHTLSFENLPVSITVAPGQLHSVGALDGVVTVRLRNGCRIDVGPLPSRAEAERLVNQVIDAGDRARDLRPTPATKEQYLDALRRGPGTFPHVGGETAVLPPDWVADAWDLPGVQHTICDGGIIREYLKGNGLCCSKEFLAILSAALRTEQVVRLYEDIRGAQPDREPEFRDEFLTAFAAHAPALPPADETPRPASRAPRPEAAPTWQAFDDEDDIPF